MSGESSRVHTLKGLRSIDGWFFDSTPQHWAVIARIVLGGVLFSHWLFYFPYLQQLFGPDGISGQFSIHRIGIALITVPDFLHRSYLIRVESEQVIWILYGLLLTSALTFALGLWTRISGVLLVVLHVLFHARNPTVLWGWNSIIQLFTFYTLLSNPGRYASLDAWLRHRRDPDFSWFAVGTGPAWPMRLIQVHVCCMYAFSISRFDEPGWLSGDMLYRALTDTRFARLPVDWNPFRGPLAIGTYGVLLLEPLAPLVLWLPRVGKWWAVALLAMHLGLELLTTVGWWSQMMAVGLVPFLPTAWIAAPFERLRTRGSR